MPGADLTRYDAGMTEQSDDETTQAARDSAKIVINDEAAGMSIKPLDIVLGVLVFPVALFVLMFATSGLTDVLRTPSRRRKFLLLMLVLEAAAIALLVWALTK